MSLNKVGWAEGATEGRKPNKIPKNLKFTSQSESGCLHYSIKCRNGNPGFSFRILC